MLKKLLAFAILALSFNALAEIDAVKALETAEKNGVKAGRIKKVKKDDKAFFLINRTYADMRLRIDAESGEIIPYKTKAPAFSLMDAVKKAQNEGEVLEAVFFKKMPKIPANNNSDNKETKKTKSTPFYLVKVLKEGTEQRIFYSAKDGEVITETEEMKQFFDRKKSPNSSKKDSQPKENENSAETE